MESKCIKLKRKDCMKKVIKRVLTRRRNKKKRKISKRMVMEM